MYRNVDFEQDIDTIIRDIESNHEESLSVRKLINQLRVNEEEVAGNTVETRTSFKFDMDDDSSSKETDDYFGDIISLYHTIGASEEELKEILPDSNDYRYNDILLRLQAESLRDIKEITEMSMEDGTYKDSDVQSFIQSEYAKIDILQTLMLSDIEELEDIEHSNKLLLIPNPNGRIRVLDDLDHIPTDHYDEVNDLIMSIVNGTFKSVKRFTKSTNPLVSGVCEVRGNLARVFFKRLNSNTYAIITAFLKKVDNDKGYQDYIRCRIREFKLYEDRYKQLLDDDAYMELNDFYVEELFNRIGNNNKEKVNKKVNLDD